MSEITASEIEYLRICLQRETNHVEAAKLQHEIEEKERIYTEQHVARLKQIEEETPYIIGNK